MKKYLLFILLMTCIMNHAFSQSCLFDSQITTADSVLCAGEMTTLNFNVSAGTPVDTVLPTPLINNNGQDGNMFNITATNTIRIKYFEGNIANTPNATTEYYIYYKVGTHVGFETNPGAWTLVAGPINFNPNAPNTLTTIPVNLNIVIPAGQTYAFYLTNTSAISNNNRYHNGTATGTVLSTNADLTVFEGTGGAYPFAATFFNARPWEGIIHYDYPTPTYLWNTGATTTSIMVQPGVTTDYSCVATFPGCFVEDTITVQVNALPPVSANPATAAVCMGSNLTLSGGGANTYVWNGPQVISDNTPFAAFVAGTYTVTGTDVNGCSNTATSDVLIHPLPPVTASANPSTTCNNTSVTPIGGGALTYVWSGGLTDNIPFIAIASNTYTVNGTDVNGCTASSTVSVTVSPSSGALAAVTSNQTQNHDDDFDLDYYDGACNLIASVDDGAGGNILGLTTATVTVDATAGNHNGQPFLRRWYQITPANSGSADVVLYFNQSDFDDYNAIVLPPYLPLPTSGNNADPNIPNIRITKNDDGGLGNSPLTLTPSVNWNGTYWELSFNTPSFSQFRIHGANPGNAPLPATLLNFNGKKLDNLDQLSWTTGSEQNNAFFNLQHSSDGIRFKTIAMVNSKAANGSSATPLHYNAVNPNPVLGHNYYRLQQVDIDHKTSMHMQIVDLIWGTNGSTVSIYPNPVRDVLNVDLYATKAQNTTVKILDMSGRIVKQVQAKSTAGMNNISISMPEVASGLYAVQVFENDVLMLTGKVRKQE